jgi:hypothetical protein
MVYIYNIFFLYSCFLTQMPSRYVSMFKSTRWTDLLLCNWWTLLIVPLYNFTVGFLKCSDIVVIFCFSFHYRKFVTLIIPLWLMHCLLSGVDFIILMWYYLFSLLIIGSSWHWLFCGDWYIVCWVEWILSSSCDTICFLYLL